MAALVGYFFNRVHSSAGGTASNAVREVGELIRVPLGSDLDSTVGPVPNPSGKTGPAGSLSRVPAEAHPLYWAPHEETCSGHVVSAAERAAARTRLAL